MKEQADKASIIKHAVSRRDFLRGLSGGALMLGAGQWLAGCGGGGAGPAPVVNVPYTMFISTFLARSVLRYESTTGTLTEFAKFAEVSDEGKEPQTTAGLVVSPDKQNLFVFSPGSDQIFMLDTGSGAVKRVIRGDFTTTSHSGVIAPDGLLYFVNAPSINAIPGSGRPDTVEILDPATGDHVGTFLNSNTTPEVRGPFGLEFGPDGDLYVVSVLSFGFNPLTFPFRSDHISRFDGTTGQFKGFASRQEHLAFTLAFHPNGQMLVPSIFFRRVYTYNAASATLLDAFANVDYPIQYLYGPDGDLYVTSFTDREHLNLLTDNPDSNDLSAQGAGRVVRFDGTTGAEKQVVVSNLPYAGFLAFL